MGQSSGPDHRSRSRSRKAASIQRDGSQSRKAGRKAESIQRGRSKSQKAESVRSDRSRSKSPQASSVRKHQSLSTRRQSDVIDDPCTPYSLARTENANISLHIDDAVSK